MRTIISCVLFLVLSHSAALAIGTGFTYQGELMRLGEPANGSFDFQFELFDADVMGGTVAGRLNVDNVAVRGGVFSVELDFGMIPPAADQLWLEIGVRDGVATGEFTRLSPRQKITAAPFALHAQTVPPSSITRLEIDTRQVQARVAGACTAEQAIRAIDGDGNVVCENDTDTTYAAGAGLLLQGTEFSVDAASVQTRVAGVCPGGQAVSAVNIDGTVACIDAPAGADGMDGADGRTLLSGNAPPDDEVDGVDGDFYIDTSVYDIYGPKAAGSWGPPTRLAGGGGSAAGTVWVSPYAADVPSLSGYTLVSVLNTGIASLTVTIEFLGADGSQVATRSFPLTAGSTVSVSTASGFSNVIAEATDFEGSINIYSSSGSTADILPFAMLAFPVDGSAAIGNALAISGTSLPMFTR